MSDDTFDKRLLIPVQEAFQILGISANLGYREIREGNLQTRALGSRTYVSRLDLQNFVDTLPTVAQRQEKHRAVKAREAGLTEKAPDATPEPEPAPALAPAPASNTPVVRRRAYPPKA